MSGEQFKDLFALPLVVPPRSKPRPVLRPRCPEQDLETPKLYPQQLT